MEVNDTFIYHYGIPKRSGRYPWGSGKKPKQHRRALDDKRLSTQKSRRKMTDSQLKKRVERLKLEKDLKDLEYQTMDEGKRYTTDILKSIGKKSAIQIGTAATVFAVATAVAHKYPSLSKYIPNAKNQW